MVDFNGDGRNDVISGSYSPGYLYLFAQQADGTYAAKEKIKHADGKSINVGSAAHMYAADWDGDQDLDLVVGNISGEVFYILNEGAPGENSFGEAQQLSAGDKPIRAGHGDAGPVLADWDGDGLLDLIVGAGDGSVTCYRNNGTKTEPALEKGESLVAASDRQNPASGCGTRTKVCVTDYNGDGLSDLLVGDFAYVQEQQPERTPEQQAEADKAQQKYQAVVQEYLAAYQKTELPKLQREFQRLRKEPDGETPAEALARENKVEELMAQIQAITKKELQPFLDRMTEFRRKMPVTQGTYRGLVWLYLRQQADATAAGG